MIRRVASIAALTAALTACGASPPTAAPTAQPTATATSAAPAPTTGQAAPMPTLFPLPPGMEPGPGDIRVDPRTAPTAESGKPYPYTLGHCGIGSPIDFDASLWDVLGAQNGRDGEPTEDQVNELINAGFGTMTLVVVDRAVYRTASGLILGLRRHEGPKAYPGCA